MAKKTNRYFWQDDDPLWYKDAVIYELPVRAFFDSNSDGIGDFPGLTQKLDYLHDLGVNALWVLPFYPSPSKDDGYDIADYTQVHPAYGTLHDFRTLLEEANNRGIRIITELVLNHTSDQHAWFQRARRAAATSRWHDFYVWSQTDKKYPEARIIFKDFESSNWAWDTVARAYYWHRFYSHQPDLNYENPAVQRAMLRVVDFWLGMGVAGLRLDAVPYLYEAEGTTGENLPETHAFLKKLRQHVDSRFNNRMLLAEANQWAEDAVSYFGKGDECHMAFHFPLMPRLFMAMRMEDRFPIVDIMEETPAIPNLCQWALFLRNHDELTLEMVTDEERDYMYRAYAHDPAARLNLGIRRRLAPLLSNNRRKIELMNALLFSLPGTPVIYYGDEIGMGDNFYLGDRNGVRTPMQWSADRNAGFSRTNPQRLYLPIIIDPEYHYEAVNVETQQANPDSLLWWMKRLVNLRRHVKALGRGSLEFLQPDNRKILAFVRRYQNETVLVIANLSRMSQYLSLNLSRFAGSRPIEIFSRAEFPPVGDTPYSITMSPYDYHWFLLEAGTREEISIKAAPLRRAIPGLKRAGDWPKLFKHEASQALESAILGYIRRCRWFGGKARYVSSLRIGDVVPLSYDTLLVHLVLVRIEYTDGEPETYFLSLGLATGEAASQFIANAPQAVIAHIKLEDRAGEIDAVIYDGLAGKAASMALLDAMSRRRSFSGKEGKVSTSGSRLLTGVRRTDPKLLEPVPVKAEQSNSSVIFGDRFILKVFRRLAEGANPELEIGQFLTKQAFPNTPALLASLEYQSTPGREPATLAVLNQFLPGTQNTWHYTLDNIARYFETILARPDMPAPPLPGDNLLTADIKSIPETAKETIGPYLITAQTLGERTAQLHLALGSSADDVNFAPEPFTLTYQRSIYHAMRRLAAQVWLTISQSLTSLPQQVRPDLEKLLTQEDSIMACFQGLVKEKIDAQRIRVHGDYHLGQVLYNGKDFIIIDFEGEPIRSLGERRLKRSPLRDVAGMIRSFHYAVYTALYGKAPALLRFEDAPRLEPWAGLWYFWVSATFLDAYQKTMMPSSLLPTNPKDLQVLFNAFLLEKSIYEVGYELNNRPDWVGIPLHGIQDMLAKTCLS